MFYDNREFSLQHKQIEIAYSITILNFIIYFSSTISFLLVVVVVVVTLMNE
jgi:hypothetical protein